MTQGKIARQRKKPVQSAARRDRMLGTLAVKVYHLLEDAEQRLLFACSTSVMRDNGQTCIGAFRPNSDPESIHELVLDTRLCQGCAAYVALRLASHRIDKKAGRVA